MSWNFHKIIAWIFEIFWSFQQEKFGNFSDPSFTTFHKENMKLKTIISLKSAVKSLFFHVYTKWFYFSSIFKVKYQYKLRIERKMYNNLSIRNVNHTNCVYSVMLSNDVFPSRTTLYKILRVEIWKKSEIFAV